MHNLNGSDGSVTIIGAVSPQGGDFSEPVTQNTKRFVRCFWGLDKSLAYARHFPAIHWLTSYSEYLTDLAAWYHDNVSPKFVDYRNRIMALLNQESSLMEIVKLIGSDVLPDDQKLVLEIARVIRLGFLQQNAFHKDDTCVSLQKQYKVMEIILYLYKRCRELVAMNMPMSVLKEENIFERVIAIKYDVPNDNLQLLDQYLADIDAFHDHIMEKISMLEAVLSDNVSHPAPETNKNDSAYAQNILDNQNKILQQLEVLQNTLNTIGADAKIAAESAKQNFFTEERILAEENKIEKEEPSLMEETPIEEEPSVMEETPIEEEPSVMEETPVEEEPSVMKETPIEEVPSDMEEPSIGKEEVSSPEEDLSKYDDIMVDTLTDSDDNVPVEKIPLEDETVVDDEPAMPDLSDPNKVMTPDEIAALIANL